MATPLDAKLLLLDIKRRASKGGSQMNPLALYHVRFMNAMGSWIPYEQFMEMPITRIYELMDAQGKIVKEQMKHIDNNFNAFRR